MGSSDLDSANGLVGARLTDVGDHAHPPGEFVDGRSDQAIELRFIDRGELPRCAEDECSLVARKPDVAEDRAAARFVERSIGMKARRNGGHDVTAGHLFFS